MSEGNGGAPRFVDLLIAGSPLERRKSLFKGQELYFRTLTRAAIAAAMPKDKMQRAPDYEVLFMLVACTEYEDGSKVFRMDEIEKLRTQLPVSVLHELEQLMLAVQYPSDKEAEQELDANPPSIIG